MEDRPARPWVGELAPVLPIAALEVVGSWLAGHHQTGVRHYDVGGALLLAAGAAALAGRRRQPAAVLAVVLGTTLAYAAADYPDGPIFLALVVAFANAVLTGHRRAAWASLAVGYPCFLLADTVLHDKPGPGLAAAVGLAAWLIALATAAEVVRARRERGIEAIRTREEEARRRAGEERLRIAQELHDVLAHNISLINVQAGVALHLMDEQPEQARTALTAIRDASKDALAELRSVLDILRQTGEAPPRSPTAGLADLPQLISGTEAAGLTVHSDIHEPVRPLPPGLDLAAYRIVQEALTNVTRHANARSATVRITEDDRVLTVEV